MCLVACYVCRSSTNVTAKRINIPSLSSCVFTSSAVTDYASGLFRFTSVKEGVFETFDMIMETETISEMSAFCSVSTLLTIHEDFIVVCLLLTSSINSEMAGGWRSLHNDEFHNF
jgi:hypothetical protein